MKYKILICWHDDDIIEMQKTNKQTNKKTSIICLDLQPPAQITILSPVAHKNPSSLAFQISYPLSMSNTPSLKALYCFVYLCLSSSTCIHASFTLFKWLFKGHVFRDTSLSMQHEMVLQSIFISSLAFSLFPPPLLYPFLSPSFFLVPFLLFFYLPSFPPVFLFQIYRYLTLIIELSMLP